MNRRGFLRVGLAGGTAVGGLAAVAYHGDGDDPRGSRDSRRDPSTATPDTEIDQVNYAEEFGTVVSAVAAGADPEGDEPINDLVREYAADDTLLSFPEGTYRLDPLEIEGHTHFGIAATSEERPTFVAPEGVNTGDRPYVWFDGVEDVLLAGIDFDFRRERAGGELRVAADGDATLRDVSTVGNCAAQIAMVRVDIRDEDGTGLFENFRALNHNGNQKLTGVYVGKHHAGEVTFRDCDLEGFTNNGLYASAPGTEDGADGVVHAAGGTFENNNIANVRLGSAGSTARGVSIVCDSAPTAEEVNRRGIRLRWQRDQVVEDCDIRFEEGTGESFGAVTFHSGNAGAEIRDTRITVDQDGIPGIRAFPYPEETASAPVFENLTIDGSAATAFAAIVDGRDGTVFRDCTIEQTGTDRGGLRIAYSEGCRIVDSRIEVTGNPIVLRQSSALVRNTTLVTPDGEQHIEEMNAEDEDFTPR